MGNLRVRKPQGAAFLGGLNFCGFNFRSPSDLHDGGPKKEKKNHLMVQARKRVKVNTLKCTLGTFYNKDLVSNEKRIYQYLISPRQKEEGQSHSIWPTCILSVSPKEIGGKTKKHL